MCNPASPRFNIARQLVRNNKWNWNFGAALHQSCQYLLGCSPVDTTLYPPNRMPSITYIFLRHLTNWILIGMVALVHVDSERLQSLNKRLNIYLTEFIKDWIGVFRGDNRLLTDSIFTLNRVKLVRWTAKKVQQSMHVAIVASTIYFQEVVVNNPFPPQGYC